MLPGPQRPRHEQCNFVIFALGAHISMNQYIFFSMAKASRAHGERLLKLWSYLVWFIVQNWRWKRPRALSAPNTVWRLITNTQLFVFIALLFACSMRKKYGLHCALVYDLFRLLLCVKLDLDYVSYLMSLLLYWFGLYYTALQNTNFFRRALWNYVSE